MVNCAGSNAKLDIATVKDFGAVCDPELSVGAEVTVGVTVGFTVGVAFAVCELLCCCYNTKTLTAIGTTIININKTIFFMILKSKICFYTLLIFYHYPLITEINLSLASGIFLLPCPIG